MSTTPSPHATASVSVPPAEREVRVYSHSPLFYWWPVWAVGFIMFGLTYIDRSVMAVVPAGTAAARDATVKYKDQDKTINWEHLDVLLLPEGKQLPPRAEKGEAVPPPNAPRLRMARNKNYGVLYAVVLLLTIFVTNVPLRGLWSILLVLFVVLIIVTLALTHAWDWVVTNFHYIDIRINAGGYLFISLVLLILWTLTVFVFDRRTFVSITPGQVRVCLAVGAGETVYDTTGMTFQKKQDDLFRNWIIGLGSGDLILHRTNTNQEIDLPNVLFVGAKIKEIEKLVKEREVV